MSLEARELERFVATLAAKPERWAHLVRHSNEMRVYEQIWGDQQVNAYRVGDAGHLEREAQPFEAELRAEPVLS